MHASFASGIEVMTRLTLPPDSECQAGYSEILSVKISWDFGQADYTEEERESSPTTFADSTEKRGGGFSPNFLHDRRIGVVSRIAMDKQLQK